MSCIENFEGNMDLSRLYSEFKNFEKIVLIWNTFLDFFYWCLLLVFPNLKLQNLLHFFRISLESDSASLRDVFNNPRNKGQIGGIFLFLFKHLSWSTNVLGTINHFQILATWFGTCVECSGYQLCKFQISAVMTLAGGLVDLEFGRSVNSVRFQLGGRLCPPQYCLYPPPDLKT